MKYKLIFNKHINVKIKMIYFCVGTALSNLRLIDALSNNSKILIYITI